MRDKDLLIIMRDRNNFNKFYDLVSVQNVGDDTKMILGDYELYFKENEEASEINKNSFITWFFMVRHPSFQDQVRVTYEALLEEVLTADTDADFGHIERCLIELESATQVNAMILDFQNGEDVDYAEKLRYFADKLEIDLDTKVELPENKTPIAEILERELNDEGLSWGSIDCLDRTMKKLKGGEFIVVAARPNMGKTTFCAQLGTEIIKQCPAGKELIWLCNEGHTDKIRYRLIQSALSLTDEQMKEMSKTTNLEQQARIEVGGHPLRVFDVIDYTNYQILNILRETNAGLVIADMIDNIRFIGLPDGRKDEILEYKYQWARNRAIQMNIPWIGTSQISADGEGLPHPTRDMLKDSKTGKQGACDIQIMIGHDPDMEHHRWINIVKSKSFRTGQFDPRQRVIFDPHRGRFIENLAKSDVIVDTEDNNVSS